MLKNAALKNLSEVKSLIHNLSDDDYLEPLEVFSGSSLGQHVRHILEFYVCLLQEINDVVCYDERKRDLRIETDREFAGSLVDSIIDSVIKVERDYSLKLKSNFSTESENQAYLQSSYYRELAYCLEHSIHHQALIKIGVKQLKSESILCENFGVAPSTIRFQTQTTVLDS